MSRLQTQLAGISMATPIVAASGTCGYVLELADALSLKRLGAVTTKSITREPREGNDPWRIVGVTGGMMNAIGLANVGLDRFLNEKATQVASAPCHVFGSVAGHSVEDFVAVAAAFDMRTQLPLIELNVSCPNTNTGMQFGDDPKALRALLKEVRSVVTRAKLFVKMTPNAGVVALSGAAVDSGVDGLTISNTFQALSLDVETRKSRLSRGIGGLSGPGIHPIVTRMVWQVSQAVAAPSKIPIIALGGVLSWQDAAEFILVGASAVGVGTALFVDPRTPQHLAQGLERWMERQGVTAVQELVGTASV
jgi:dihydroorotate dehydrogenase (NAD+) catalytic subunit